VAHIALLLRQDRLDQAREFARRQATRTRDPLWTAAEFMVAAVTRDHAAARRLADELPDELLARPPRVDRQQPIDALLAAELLRHVGGREQAERIARAVIESHEGAPDEYQPVEAMWVRALAFASLGQTDRAVAELERARAQGFRTLIDMEYFLKLEDYPMMAQVSRDPRYAAFTRAVEADNARMRSALLAVRKAGN
jgi:hypothetical protein